MPLLLLPSRRQFALLATTALLSACRTKNPRVPTRPAPSSSSGALGSGAAGELLDTEDGTLPIDTHDPQRGPRTAHAVLVVFSDFQCPFCRDMANALERLHKERAGRVRVVFKHLPSPSHASARAAAIAAQAVFLEAGSDAFWRFHDRCFAHPRDLDSAHLAAWARDQGVQPAALAARAPEAEVVVKQHMALAARMGIRGTPRLYINARRVAGAYPYEQILEWVDDEL
ncbi:MAG: DsbA family protein [Deltaproteobacteria bacterium]|nr:DsbA family protein [Deltaproteobacteria bacterium]